MSSIVIKGDTSGQIEIAAPAVAGSNTLTLPASTGNIATTSDIADASNIVGANGTAGQVLQSDGDGTMSWADAGGGSYVLTGSTIISNGASTVNFGSSAFDSSLYGGYMIALTNVQPNTQSRILLRFSTNGGSTWNSSGIYSWKTFDFYSTASSQNSDTSGRLMSNNVGNASAGDEYGVSGLLYLSNPANGKMANLDNHLMWIDGISNLQFGRSVVQFRSTTAINGIQFFWESGTFQGGEIRIYGLTKA